MNRLILRAAGSRSDLPLAKSTIAVLGTSSNTVIRNDDGGIPRQVKAGGEFRGDSLYLNSDAPARHAAVVAELRIQRRHDIGGNRKSKILTAAERREDQRVDANQVAVGVDQRTATAPRIDRGVGLDVDVRLSSSSCRATARRRSTAGVGGPARLSGRRRRGREYADDRKVGAFRPPP